MKVVYTDEALSDLEHILEYISENSPTSVLHPLFGIHTQSSTV
jgi:plasmid stabilization system protein ParE